MSARTNPKRREARVLALLALYEADVAGHPVGEALSRHLAQAAPTDEDGPRELPPETVAYAAQLTSGVTVGRADIDALLAQCAPEHPVADLAAIDRNILRIAIFELRAELAPVKVVVNEAIELAKLFGSDASPRFTHGVLGTVTQRLAPLGTMPAEAAA